MQSRYGSCSRCDTPLVPIWFTEEETKVVECTFQVLGVSNV